MTNYVKIDRATGDILKRKVDVEKRVFNKAVVWIEIEQQVRPVYNNETHRLNPVVTQPDLSDLNLDVPPTTKRVESWEVVILTAQELDDRQDGKATRLLADIGFKVLIKALNDGSFVPGASHTNAQLKAFFKARM